MIKEKFLIDSNSFIAASRFFYAMDIVPSFWPLFEESVQQENVAIIDVVKDEIMKGEDSLSEWLQSLEHLTVIKRDREEILGRYQAVMEYLHTSGYYTEKARKIWSDFNVADPWLVATGAAYGYTIITFEESAGIITTKNPSGKPKIPDFAKHFGVRCENLYYFMRVQQLQI